MKGKILLGVLVLFALTSIAVSYDLVLKNGKIVKGKLISEDQDKFVVEDESGTKMNFKKASVDLEKTAAANTVVETPPAPVAAAKPAEEEKPAALQKPKKPARKFTENDLYRLRSKYPMSGGSTTAGSEEDAGTEQTGEPEERTEEQWKADSQNLLNRVKELEAVYQESVGDCQMMQGASIQTHRVVNEKGEVQNMQETTKEMCQQAEDAKAMLEQAREDYENFLEEAKMQVVPPGWIAQDE